MTAPLDARPLFRLLAEVAIDYGVVGGFAVIAHVMKRAAKRSQARICVIHLVCQ